MRPPLPRRRPSVPRHCATYLRRISPRSPGCARAPRRCITARRRSHLGALCRARRQRAHGPAPVVPAAAGRGSPGANTPLLPGRAHRARRSPDGRTGRDAGSDALRHRRGGPTRRRPVGHGGQRRLRSRARASTARRTRGRAARARRPSAWSRAGSTTRIHGGMLDSGRGSPPRASSCRSRRRVCAPRSGASPCATGFSLR